MHSGMMWRFVNCTLCLLVFSQLILSSVWAAADELDGEVITEVLFKPDECTRNSKKGDLINAHYDGYLAKGGSQFYCRLVVYQQFRNIIITSQFHCLICNAKL